MSDPRNFEYLRCPECKREWRVWSPYAYDPTDSHPVFTPELCVDCFEAIRRPVCQLKEEE